MVVCIVQDFWVVLSYHRLIIDEMINYYSKMRLMVCSIDVMEKWRGKNKYVRRTFNVAITR